MVLILTLILEDQKVLKSKPEDFTYYVFLYLSCKKWLQYYPYCVQLSHTHSESSNHYHFMPRRNPEIENIENRFFPIAKLIFISTIIIPAIVL